MLVTGASRGIGAEIALGAAKENYLVIVNYAKQADDANHVVKQIISAGGQALAMQADCSKEEDIVRLFEQIDQIGTLDSFVANAGIIGGQNPVSQTTASQLKELFDINVIGLILCTREAVKRMSTELGGIGGKITGALGNPTAALTGQLNSALSGAIGSVGSSLGGIVGGLGGLLGGAEAAAKAAFNPAGIVGTVDRASVDAAAKSILGDPKIPAIAFGPIVRRFL